MADWSTIASLSTAAGTLVLAFATFSATRSSNRSARIAERALEARLRPVLVPSRFEDRTEKVMWVDEHWEAVPGGMGVAKVGDGAIYLAMSVRNVGTGMGVIHGWHAYPIARRDAEHTEVGDFRLQTRDLYVPPGDASFWQGAFREDDGEEPRAIVQAIDRREIITIELLYGDHEGGQRTVSRFTLVPRDDHDNHTVWIVTVNRHWNLDRDDPR